jgi:serine beta-lactamase-like protein LACTB
MVVAVSKNNEVIYSRGFGYSDIENNIKANCSTVMRIASISKPITIVVAAKLIELNKLDIDKPINEYIDNLPTFKYKNKEYEITTRQLMCHTSGIRHYKEETQKEKKEKEKTSGEGDTAFAEFYLNKKFKNTKDALSIFINDELVNEPGKFQSLIKNKLSLLFTNLYIISRQKLHVQYLRLYSTSRSVGRSQQRKVIH